MLDAKFFNMIGPNARDRYRKHTFKDAKDVYGRKFKGYTAEYGERKRAGKYRRQAAEFTNSKAPVLTSDFLRDFSLMGTTANSFRMGWSTHGERVGHLAKRGRVLSANNQVMPKDVIKFINREAVRYVKKKLPKKKVTRIKI